MTADTQQPNTPVSDAADGSTNQHELAVATDDEIEGLRKISEALVGRDKATCARMLDWAADIFTDSVLMPGCRRGRDFPPRDS